MEYGQRKRYIVPFCSAADRRRKKTRRGAGGLGNFDRFPSVGILSAVAQVLLVLWQTGWHNTDFDGGSLPVR